MRQHNLETSETGGIPRKNGTRAAVATTGSYFKVKVHKVNKLLSEKQKQ